MRRILTGVLLCVLTALSANAFNTDSLHVDARLGYSIGGTPPLTMDATIRKIKAFHPIFGFSGGATITYEITDRWGIAASLLFERKGMDVNVKVKNYDVVVNRGGEHLEGLFLGDVKVKEHQYSLTLPVQASYWVSRKVRLRLGPYFSYVTGKRFEGWAYNGYLRVDGPTGMKVELGEEAGTRGDFEFSQELRSFQMGVDLAADWRFHRRWGAYASLDFGFNNIFKGSFTTVAQTLHPLYLTLGMTYQIQ